MIYNLDKCPQVCWFWLIACCCLEHKEIQQIRIPVKFRDLSDDEFKHRLEDRPILDPHLVIEYLFNTAKLTIPREEVRRYWNHHAHFGEKWAQSCDNFDRIPLGLFGDNARVTTQYGKVVQLIGIFMNLVLWRPGSVRLSRFLLFSIGDHELWGHHTLQAVYRRITWSLNSLWEGRHPEAGAWGEPLGPNLQKKLASGLLMTRYSSPQLISEATGAG